MCCADLASAARILSRLRSGVYDEALGYKDLERPEADAKINGYPRAEEL